MDLLIALGIGGVASVLVLSFAWALSAEHDAPESGSDAFEDWFPEAHSTEMSEEDVMAMWSGGPVVEVEPPTRSDLEAT